MMNETMTGGLVQVWITTTAEDGSSRLESRWTSAAEALALHSTHAA